VPYYEILIRSDDDGDGECDAVIDADVCGIAVETGLRCTRVGHATRLDGELIDRAALHGAIARVFQLDLDLLAVERRS
jgi:hypothetical protein